MSEGIRSICMPKWGLSMKEGKVAAWLVEEGHAVAPGDEVIDIETEKIASAVEAVDGGLLRRRVADVGEVLPVGALLGIVADDSVDDTDIESFVADFQANFVPPDDDDEEESGPATETVEVAGRTIRYLTRGDGGTPVILVHGFGGDLHNWLFNHEALAGSRTVHALDLPGHGSSSKEVGDGSIGFLADIVLGFADALGIDRAHLVGHSMGGAVSLACARSAPQRVASLTLIASAGLGREIDGDYLDGFISAERRRDLKPHVEKLFSDPALVTRQIVDDLLAFKRIDGVTAALGTIRDALAPGGEQAEIMREVAGSVPTLVIWGSEDRIIPASHAHGLANGVSSTVLDGQGHMVQMEAATDVNRLVADHVGA